MEERFFNVLSLFYIGDLKKSKRMLQDSKLNICIPLCMKMLKEVDHPILNKCNDDLYVYIRFDDFDKEISVVSIDDNGFVKEVLYSGFDNEEIKWLYTIGLQALSYILDPKLEYKKYHQMK